MNVCDRAKPNGCHSYDQSTAPVYGCKLCLRRRREHRKAEQLGRVSARTAAGWRVDLACCDIYVADLDFLESDEECGIELQDAMKNT